MQRLVRSVLLTLLLLAGPTAGGAWAQGVSRPSSAPAIGAPLPRAEDKDYPGVIRLEVDATDLARKIFRIRQTIPVAQAGPLTLLYPEWIPGNHAPRGPVYNYAGLRISANGKPIAWKRDAADMFAFRIEVPQGARSIDIEAQFLNPVEPTQGPIVVTADMMRFNWYAATLYPAGHYARGVRFDATLKLPKDWTYASALETESRRGDTVRFKTVSMETLLDSPVYAGAHGKTWELQPAGTSTVRLNAFGDTAEMISPTEDVLQIHRNLIVQADKLFGGARQFNHYDFLLSVSERLAGAGIEHHRSSSNGVRGGYFRNWTTALTSRDLLAHEYVHSWNGKFRRPADLWTPHYNTPMGDSLLWVYEGQTQYWGLVLAARSGFLTRDQALETLAITAAAYEARAGRAWRPLADTTLDPIIAARRALPWRSWQRSEDYYSEGQLIWLDADTRIRESSGDQKSLDDFAKAFFGGRDGDWGVLTYTRADVVAAMKSVASLDWEVFFKARVDDVAPTAPLDGLARGGYRLVYRTTPGEVWKDNEERNRLADLTYSAGLVVGDNARIQSVQWEGPAFEAGLTSGLQIEAVNGKEFSLAALRDAVAATGRDGKLDLLVRIEGDLQTVSLKGVKGPRYPSLERVEGSPDRLGAILAAR
jgi:predicted metalloprotease with PDZ domain